MKKLLSLFMLAVITTVGFAASAAQRTIVITVNDPATVSGYLTSTWESVTFHEGDNVFTEEEGTYMQLNTEDGYFFASATIDGEADPDFRSSDNYLVAFMPAFDGCKIHLTTKAYAEARTASVSLFVDDASNVGMRFNNTYFSPEIVTGENTIAFVPEVESAMTIFPLMGERGFYKVLHNGEEISYNWGSYYLYDVQDGDRVEVITEFPDIPVAVSFEIEDGAEGVLSQVLENNEPRTDFLEDVFTVNMGSVLQLYFDETQFEDITVVINGENVYAYSGMSITITEETSIAISAEKKTLTQINVNVDNPDAVEVWIGGTYSGYRMDVVAGNNAVQTSNGSQLQFVAKEGYVLASVIRINEDRSTEEEYIYNMNECSVYYQSYMGECSWVITTGKLDDLRTAHATVNVDHADKAQLYLAGGEVALVDGENTVAFIPGAESTFRVSGVSGAKLYSVEHNGNPVEITWGEYAVEGVEDGDIITIVTDFPEGDATVTVSLADGTPADFVRGLYGNIEEYDWTAPVTVPLGTELTLRLDTDAYKLASLKVNGVDVTSSAAYGQYTFTANSENISIEVEAREYGDITMYVVCDYPEAITLSYYADYSQVNVMITETEQAVTLSETIDYVTINHADKSYRINSVTDNNGVTYDMSYGSAYVQPEDGLVITVNASELVFDSKAVAYISGGTYYSVTVASEADSRNEVLTVDYGTVYDGYYKNIKFNASDNPFRLTAYAPSTVYAYLNGEQLASDTDSGLDVSGLVLADNDVLKIFSYEPTQATINVADENGLAEVYTDYVTLQASKQFDVFVGTLVTIKADGAIVKLDGVELVAADGEYTFTPSLPEHQVEVISASGIESVLIDGNATHDVYNAQGMLMMRNASADRISNLPAGLYIIGGHKVIKR